MLCINNQEEMDNLDISSVQNINEIIISNVSIIPEGKFANLKKLQSVTINNVKKIDVAAFMNCTNLKEFNFDKNLTLINDFGFNNTKVVFLKNLYPNIILGVYNNELSDITSLEDTPWYIINELAIRNVAQDYFNIGDSKKVQIGNFIYDFIILDFNHDDLANDTNKAGITFGSKQLYEKLYCMDKGGYSCYSWGGSDLRKYLIDDCYYKIPKELRKIIKNVTKKTFCNNEITKTTDNLFILSEKELCNMSEYSFPDKRNEGYLYKYYENANNRYKSKIDTNHSTLYWLRSPEKFSERKFIHSWVSNSCGSQLASTQLGINLNFCI